MIDSSGADVGLLDMTIAEMGRLGGAEAAKILDAVGLDGAAQGHDRSGAHLASLGCVRVSLVDLVS